MKQNEGWRCPVCGRGVAPDQKYCECVTMGLFSTSTTITCSLDKTRGNTFDNITNYDEVAEALKKALARNIAGYQP